MATWCTLTLFILFLQDAIFFTPETSENSAETGQARPNFHVVVGHYNGNLPDEKRRNLTSAQLNANNYSPIENWGESGRAVHLEPAQQKEADAIFPINQFNLYVSDRISVNRTIPDVRKPTCRNLTYEIEKLPNTSVIIVYHNEAYSTLMRTVWSVINRSPRSLLAEIILVDDFSNRTFLAPKTFDKSLQNLPTHVKIIRSKTRVGLIRARMMGAQEAQGEVLTFLDSHCEATQGWLEPLLDRIRQNRKAVPCPIIDIINDDNFQYQKGIEMFRGGFNWNLQFRWYSMPANLAKEHAKTPTAPILSPTMAGGLFSINRQYFEELGEYDPGMDIWGGENLEMSFRIWQCGGRVEILPCSHVGHVFRKSSPHDFPGKSSGKVLNENLMRVAEVWMDDWKEMFYKIAPQASRMRNSIDVSDRVELRKKLGCKPFSWYLKTVFTDHFLPMPGDFFGRIVSKFSTKKCLSWALKQSGIKAATISEILTEEFRKQQLWLYTTDSRLRTDEHLCLSNVQLQFQSKSWQTQLKECAGNPNEYWDFEKGKLRNRESGLCLTIPTIFDNSKDELNPPIVEKCAKFGEVAKKQQWIFRDVKWLKL